MAKRIVLLLTVLAILAIPGTAQNSILQQCVACQQVPFGCHNVYAGGCGCKVFYKNGINYCAPCGGCAAFICAYPCDAPVPAAVQLKKQSWLKSKTIGDRVAVHSTVLAGILRMEQEQLAKGASLCSSPVLAGLIQDTNTGRKYEWQKMPIGNGALYSIREIGTENKETLLVNHKGFSLSLGKDTVVKYESLR